MRKHFLQLFVLLPTSLVLIHAAMAARAAEQGDAIVSHANPADVDAWRKLKFGLFIHWGPVSLEGTEIGWSRRGERRGSGATFMPTGGVPVEVYDNLYKKFNPTKFDPDEWVQIAKDAGMKYMVLTTKHHDGFCMFDSALSDYKITSPESPYGRDIVKQLSDACHKADFIWGVYYSQPDWHHPDYHNGPERHKKYIEYLHGQVREVLTNYGTTRMLFFDGLGGTSQDWDAPRLINMCRELQPNILINNRAGVPADYDTPEQRIGKMQTERPWETCMTIGDQWAWKPNDDMKSFKQCIQTLVRVVGGDGNLLFNVGPMPDGRIEPRQVERLREMGEWLAKHGESIHDTRGGPFRPGSWGAATYRDNTVYLHILDGGKRAVTLPAIEKKIVSHKVLTGGAATVEQTDESIVITLDEDARNDVDVIVALTLDGPAAEANPGAYASDSVSAGKKATASSVFGNQVRDYGPRFAVDDDPTTRWASGEKNNQWLEIDLGKAVVIDGATIQEGYGQRVQRFTIDVKVDGQWKTVHEGRTIGEELQVDFAPVAAEAIRLNLLEATEAPTFHEFRVFAAKIK